MTANQYDYIIGLRNELMLNATFLTGEVATFIACQSALESRFGQSDICKENHNFFGMKLPVKRITTAFKEARGHAKYTSFTMSVIDYIYWLIYNGFTKSYLVDVEKFKSKLEKSNYCPSRLYISSIQSLFNSFKNYDATRKK